MVSSLQAENNKKCVFISNPCAMWPHMTGGNFVADGVAVISKIGQNRILYILLAGSNLTFHFKRREG